jgi:hypothetical protein
MTGASENWGFSRTYGCNTAIASENLLTFRSGAAGYMDMLRDGGRGNLGGFKSGCTSNLIAANGVLNAPDYTRTCTCGYQNQTSLALIYMPEAEMWTCDAAGSPSGAIRRVGVNFGAPGDRMTDTGTLWVDYPSVGGPSPGVSLSVSGDPGYFRNNAARLPDDDMGWVSASGADGVTQVSITLGNSPAVPYRVRLYFYEPDGLAAGQRLMDVSLQGSQILSNFDIASETGADARGVMKEYQDVIVGNTLTVALSASAGSPVLSGIEAVMGSDLIDPTSASDWMRYE